MAAMTSASSPAAICWLAVLPLITFAAVICPVTVPDCGKSGVRPATAAGAGVVAVWHSNMTTLPFTPRWPKWMWDCCTVPTRPLNESSYSISPSSRLIWALNSPLAGVDTEGTSWYPIRRARISSERAAVEAAMAADNATRTESFLIFALLSLCDGTVTVWGVFTLRFLSPPNSWSNTLRARVFRSLTKHVAGFSGIDIALHVLLEQQATLFELPGRA